MTIIILRSTCHCDITVFYQESQRRSTRLYPVDLCRRVWSSLLPSLILIMSRFLSEPITTKNSHQVNAPKLNLTIGYSSMQGWRDTMEDADLVRVELPGNVNGACFAIFDGHGGDFVAKQVYEQHKNSVLSFSLPIRKNSMMDCHLASNAWWLYLRRAKEIVENIANTEDFKLFDGVKIIHGTSIAVVRPTERETTCHWIEYGNDRVSLGLWTYSSRMSHGSYIYVFSSRANPVFWWRRWAKAS